MRGYYYDDNIIDDDVATMKPSSFGYYVHSYSFKEQAIVKYISIQKRGKYSTLGKTGRGGEEIR